MRIAVIGAGAIGCTIAALLSRAGHEVTVTARGAQLEAIREHGIELSGVWGSFIAPVEASEVLQSGPELIFVTTKAQDAEAALRENAEFIDGLPVVVVQNGLGSVTSAQRILRRADIVGALALYAASYTSPGHVTVTTDGVTCLGGPDEATALAAKVLGRVMPVTITQNFAGAQWTKLVVNHINALPAITGMSAQDVISDWGLRRTMTRSMREAVRVALARGIRFEKVQGLSHGLLRIFVGLPIAVAQALPLLMKARMGAIPNPGSTLQSIRRGQLTEIDYLNGAVISAAVEFGVATPVEQALVDMVHEVESTGVFLTPAQVAERVRR
ncbi:MAG: 2-dehydropantoate 2-reductase [Microbacteriaceae bacterium]|nr:2-dehydropantoate 2-reductase [Microbacteriaceae bacterium]